MKNLCNKYFQGPYMTDTNDITLVKKGVKKQSKHTELSIYARLCVEVFCLHYRLSLKKRNFTIDANQKSY